MIANVTRNAVATATRPATYPLGVQWYRPFEPTMATTMQNCTIFRNKGASHAV